MVPTTRCRLFISQVALDAWLNEGRAEIAGDELRDTATGTRFQLREGVRFLAEVSGQHDSYDLVGKVKDLEQLTALQGEHMADSVVLGDNAYEVQQGFVGTALQPERASQPDVSGVTPHRQTIAALQAFFLNHVK